MKRKWLFILLGFLCLFVVLAMWYAPEVARQKLEENGKEWTGRKITLKGLSYNYFTSTFTATGFIMHEKNDLGSFISFDTLRVDLEPLRAISSEYLMESLYCSGLRAQIVVLDSAFNFDDLLEFYLSEEDSVPADNGSTAQYHLYDMSFKNGMVEYIDTQLDDTIGLNDINLLIPYIGWDETDTSEAGVKFFFENKGFLQANLEAERASGNYLARIQIDSLDLSQFKAYADESADLGKMEGYFNCGLEIAGNMYEYDKYQLSGWAGLENFVSEDREGHPLLTFSEMKVGLTDINPIDEIYRIDTITILQPFVDYVMFDSTSNFEQAFAPSMQDDSSVVAEVDTSGSSSYYYEINTLRLIDGQISIDDFNGPEPFHYELTKVTYSIDSLSSDADWIQTFGTMILNGRGKLKLEYAFNPNKLLDMDVNYTIRDFLLSDLNLYSTHYVGVPFLTGDMYYVSKTQVRDMQMESENNLIIKDVEVGEKRGGIYDLPIKFALFLLKDKNGDITLDIPLTGNFNDPDTKIGPIIWYSLKNLLLKTVAAPGNALAGLIGADPKDLKSIEYEYLDTALTDSRRIQLDQLLELEQKKPGLSIKCLYFNDEEEEKNAIAVDLMGKKFESNKKKDYKQNWSEFEEFVQSKTKGEYKDVTTSSLELTQPEEVNALFEEFKNQRFNSIRHYLNAHSDSTAILLEAIDPRSPDHTGRPPTFDIKFNIAE